MRVTVHYMAQIKRAAGCNSEPIDLPGAVPLRDVLRRLSEHHGPDFRALLVDETGEPRKSLLLFIGEDHAELTRPLRDGDALTILTPMAGG